MKELIRLFESLGLNEVETFIASGNVIFKSPSRNARSLQSRIEAQLQRSLGYEVKTFLRTDSEVSAVAIYQPFSAAQMKQSVAFNVAFLEQPLDAAGTKLLMALKTDIDDFHVHGREAYWLCKRKQSESKFSNAVLEKALKIRSTLRGMQTIAKLVAKLEH